MYVFKDKCFLTNINLTDIYKYSQTQGHRLKGLSERRINYFGKGKKYNEGI